MNNTNQTNNKKDNRGGGSKLLTYILYYGLWAAGMSGLLKLMTLDGGWESEAMNSLFFVIMLVTSLGTYALANNAINEKEDK